MEHNWRTHEEKPRNCEEEMDYHCKIHVKQRQVNDVFTDEEDLFDIAIKAYK